MTSTKTAARVNWCLRRATTILTDTAQRRSIHATSALQDLHSSCFVKQTDPINASGTHKMRDQIAKDGLRTFIEKVTAKPKEARMWLKYFRSKTIWEHGQAFCVIHVTESVFYSSKILETFAWSTSFLMQNGMRPVVVFGVQRKSTENIQDVENKLEVLGTRLQRLLKTYGANSSFFSADDHLLRFNEERKLVVNGATMSEALESNSIPLVSNFFADPSAENKFRIIDPIRVTEVVAKVTKPLKVMLLSPEKGIKDCNGKIVSDIVLPFDMPRVQNNNWYKEDEQEKSDPEKCLQIAAEIERVGKLLEHLPTESSVIMTSADTVIQELFTHHGSGTMIKRSEKVMTYRSLSDVDTAKLGALITESFQKQLPDSYFDDISALVDRVYITEQYTAAAIILRDPAVEIPYLDKFAVRTSSQGLGISAQLWAELSKDYKQLFWRSQVFNHSANNWYSSVCQGSWKQNQWIVFWYGLPTCNVVFPLIDFAMKRKETFIYEESQKEDEGPRSASGSVLPAVL